MNRGYYGGGIDALEIIRKTRPLTPQNSSDLHATIGELIGRTEV